MFRAFSRQGVTSLLSFMLVAVLSLSLVPFAPWSYQALAAPDNASGKNVESFSGADMFETSALQSQVAFPRGSASVILAGRDGWYDALAAAGLAGLLDCPILFTEQSYLPAATSAEIDRLGATEIIIIGGTSCVSDEIVSSLNQLGKSVNRLAGSNALETQLEIYQAYEAQWSGDTLFVTTLTHYADALSAAPAAFAQKSPVFLVDSSGNLTEEAKDELREAALAGNFDRCVALGGEAVVSEETMGFLDFVAALASGEGSPAIRLSGADMYGTSSALASWAVSEGILGYNNMAFASGGAPFDALAGSVLQGKSKSVLLLADAAYLSTIGLAASNNYAIYSYRYFGGEVAVASRLREYIANSLWMGYALPPGKTVLPNGISVWTNSKGLIWNFEDHIASFSTYSTNTYNGTFNMQLALNCFDGEIIWPGQTLSFFEVTDRKGASNSYLLAGVVGGLGYGGGICQASTTLYGASIRAGLTIVSRLPHTVPSTYVPIGLDAMVSSGTSDFRIRNDFDFPVKISVTTLGMHLQVDMYGIQPEWYDHIDVESWWTSNNSASARRVYYKNGSFVYSEWLPSSYYPGA